MTTTESNKSNTVVEELKEELENLNRSLKDPDVHHRGKDWYFRAVARAKELESAIASLEGAK